MRIGVGVPWTNYLTARMGTPSICANAIIPVFSVLDTKYMSVSVELGVYHRHRGVHR